MAETAETDLRNSEYSRSVNSVLLLRDMYHCQDPILRRQLFEQVCDQEASHIAEVLPGSVHTEFDFDSYDGELYVLQPEGVTDWLALHENGSKRARAMADINPSLEFYAQIAEAEFEEAKVQQQLVKDGRPQTTVTLSLCGDDLASADDLKSVGRDPALRRAYLRTSIFDGERLRLDSRTMDYMTVEEAKELYKSYLGIELPQNATSIDILKTKVLLDGARYDLPDKISYRPTFNTYDFVLRQPDLLSAHMESLSELAKKYDGSELDRHADNLRYDVMSSFKRRLDGTWIELDNLAESVTYAGTAERSEGTQFSGCDTVVSMGANGLEDAGYVNAGGRELWVWREGNCRISNCPSREKDKKHKPKIGPCDVCKACQSLFDSGMKADDIQTVYRGQKKRKKSQVTKKQPDFFEALSIEIQRYKQQKSTRP